jgi:hypothetical protein
MSTTAIFFTKLPKRHYYPAARAWCSFDDLVAKFQGKVRRYFLKQGRGWYRIFALQLATGRYACVVEWEVFPGTLEIQLELVHEYYFYEADLVEILTPMGFESVDKWRVQNDFTWVQLGAVRE